MTAEHMKMLAPVKVSRDCIVDDIEEASVLQPGITVSEKQVLRFTLLPKLYAIPSGCTPYDHIVDGVRVYESHELCPQQGFPPHTGKYRITFEAPISGSDQLLKFGSEIREAAEDLDRSWIYACGAPLHPVRIRFSFGVNPFGWESNEAEVKNFLIQNSKKTIALVRVGPQQHWMSMPDYPLRAAARAREAYRVASPPIKALGDLHYAALKALRGDARLFYFANALEVAVTVMPGAKNKAKEQSLRTETRRLLQYSMDWLFNIANNRYNVRHVINKKLGVLHSEMSGEERSAFEHDADLILRDVMCQNLGLPTPQLFDEKNRPAAPSTEGSSPMPRLPAAGE
jgi:hypothetical protein